MSQETITLGGGCFWCLEAVFDRMAGVTDVVSGYTGGHTVNPTYQQICTGTSGHAEVVQVTFDSTALSLREVLDVFFTIHDPTTLNRQGNDVGTQYRSAIYYHTAAQQALAQQMIAEHTAARTWPAPIVTEVTALGTFYPAEDYHQEYYTNNPYTGYCMLVVAPKVTKFKQKFADRVKA
jgi:peptide-methionine (S)-S-oxide reductase